jgi:hypothetical protein
VVVMGRLVRAVSLLGLVCVACDAEKKPEVGPPPVEKPVEKAEPLGLSDDARITVKSMNVEMSPYPAGPKGQEVIEKGAPLKIEGEVEIGELLDSAPVLFFDDIEVEHDLAFVSVCQLGDASYVRVSDRPLPPKDRRAGSTIAINERAFDFFENDERALGDCDIALFHRQALRYPGNELQGLGTGWRTYFHESLYWMSCKRGDEWKSEGCSPQSVSPGQKPMTPEALDVSIVAVEDHEVSMSGALGARRHGLEVVFDIGVKHAIGHQWELAATLSCTSGNDTAKQTNVFLPWARLDALQPGQRMRSKTIGSRQESGTLAAETELCTIELMGLASPRSRNAARSVPLGQWCYERDVPIKQGPCAGWTGFE